MDTIITRKDRKREQRRQSLVDTARNLFVQYGYEGTTIDQIAEAADVAKVTFYYHFKSKEELALEIKRQCHEEAVIYVEKLRGTEQTPDQMIEALIKDIVEWTEANWRLLDVFCSQRFSPLVSKSSEGDSRPEPLTMCVDVILQRGQELGIYRVDLDRLRVANLIDLAILCEQHQWVRSGRQAGALIVLLNNCFDFALNGILKR